MIRIPSVKAMVPPTPLGLVTRSRLLDRLDAAPGSALVLVCAPPGYGKTSLLADWAAHRKPAASAWLTLDEDDNDPAQLCRGVLAALLRCAAVPGDHPLQQLVAAPSESALELSGEILTALDDLPEPVHLVLDNVDQLVAPAAQDVLRALIRHRPRGLRLVLSSRLDPPLALPRLRLEGRLHELRIDRLRFSRREAGELLHTAGVGLNSAQVRAVHALTDGWPAALRLASISLKNAPDPGAFLAAFSGDDRSVAEYLVEEVLSGLQPETREFLSTTSVCDDFPPALAAALTGRQDAAVLLSRLERETAVVVQVDPREPLYRMQPLLRSYIRADLERSRPSLASALHNQAAGWWADRDDPAKSTAHVIAADDRSLAIALLHRFALRLHAAGAHQLLRRALDRIDERHSDDPWLALSSALCHLESGELPTAEAALDRAERHWPEEADAELDVLHAVTRQFHDLQAGRVVPEVRAGSAPPAGEPAARALTGLLDAVAHLPSARDRLRARRGLADTLRLADRHGFGHLTMQCQIVEAAYAAMDGDYRAMATASDTALASAEANGWLDSVWVCSARAMLAGSALLLAAPAEARRQSAQGLQTAVGGVSPAVRFALSSLHGSAVFDKGQRAAGFAEMRQARVDVADRPLISQQAASSGLLEFQAALALGRPDAAAAVLDWLVERVGVCGEANLMQAWREIGQGRPEAARVLLAPVLAPDAHHLLPATRVEALLADAECALVSGERVAARRAVQDALTRGALLDLVRPFVLAGPAVRAMVAAWPDGPDGVRSLIARVLGARRMLRQPDTVMQLSEREQAVLALLPSLLSLEEIAEDLLISVNTVKSHLRAIYLKLGVSSRRAAVVAAHGRELLTTGPSTAR